MIQWTDDKDIFGRMQVFTGDPVFSGIRNAIEINADLSSAFSWGQLKSKRWLVDELEKLDLNLETIFLCAGWYATLAAMLFNSKCNLEKIRSFDIDPACDEVADTINKSNVVDGWKFKAITCDIMDIDYSEHCWHTWSKANNRISKTITDIPKTIINTSCEHIGNFNEWYSKIPNGKILVLQSNDYFDIPEHINCSKSIDHFADATPMNTVFFSHTLSLPKYNRFMRIGVK